MSLAVIDRTAGTNIGDLTETGGLAAAFDGVTSQAAAACATKFSESQVYIGKTLALRQRFGRAVVYGSNNVGLSSDNPSITINARGKQGSAPANATDGTILGTITFTDTADESAGRIIDSTDLMTEWDHLWVEMTSGDTNWRVAELVLEHFYQGGAIVDLLI